MTNDTKNTKVIVLTPSCNQVKSLEGAICDVKNIDSTFIVITDEMKDEGMMELMSWDEGDGKREIAEAVFKTMLKLSPQFDLAKLQRD